MQHATKNLDKYVLHVCYRLNDHSWENVMLLFTGFNHMLTQLACLSR